MTIVTMDVLKLYDKYEGDFGLLDERWASKDDRSSVSKEQTQVLSEFIDKLLLLKVESLSANFRKETELRFQELAEKIDPEVIEELKSRTFK